MNKIIKKLLASFAVVAILLNIYGYAVPTYAKAGTVVKRSYNSDHISNGDGTVTASIKQKWINYLDEDGE